MARTTNHIRINPASLRHIRQLTGLGVGTLAHDSGVTHSFISNLEAGRRTVVSPPVFRALCAALRVTDVRALMANPDNELVSA